MSAAPIYHEPADVADLPLVAVNEPIWADLEHDPRLTIEHDPVLGEVRVVGGCGFVRAEDIR